MSRDGAFEFFCSEFEGGLSMSLASCALAEENLSFINNNFIDKRGRYILIIDLVCYLIVFFERG